MENCSENLGSVIPGLVTDNVNVVFPPWPLWPQQPCNKLATHSFQKPTSSSSLPNPQKTVESYTRQDFKLLLFVLSTSLCLHIHNKYLRAFSSWSKMVYFCCFASLIWLVCIVIYTTTSMFDASFDSIPSSSCARPTRALWGLYSEHLRFFFA